MVGFLSRYFLTQKKGNDWYQNSFIRKISPITLIALLATIVLMFSLKGSQIIELPLEVVKIAIPLILYFVLMFFISFLINKALKIQYDKNASIAFTATGNYSELAIAVAIANFGLSSPQAFAAVIGTLFGVPVLIFLMKVSLKFNKKYYLK
jgi:ACR3 family arsenite transporter